MEKALSAYTDEHILRYFNDVKASGLTEHGFPRLTANIGILIAHGKRRDLLPIFTEMMEFCCKSIPSVKAANDFSVREIVCCLSEIEQSGIAPKEDTDRWRGYLADIKPTECYNKFATSLSDGVRNWALFTAVSEYFRLDAGVGGDMDFIELQLGQQLRWLDGNGMYRDNKNAERHNPILYDLVPRGLFSLLLTRGYRGKYYAQIDTALKKAALLTLDMQSPNGEIAFGGRSNQFLHNEAWMIAIFEYEAKRYANEKNYALAARFKAASARALSVVEERLDKEPIRHIKNSFPTESAYGCEGYAYFDKYMITVASNLWAAYLICDDTVKFEECDDITPCAAQTSEQFHKLFVKSGGYGLEADLCGDPRYDASGVGRIHRAGAPSAICMSVPCPAKPGFAVQIPEPRAFSLCAGVKNGDAWCFATGKETAYEVAALTQEKASAKAEIVCCFENGKTAKSAYTVSENGVFVEVCGEGEIAFSLPAFEFDGETHTEIVAETHTLEIRYEGWVCRYETDGEVVDLGYTAENRNGRYRAFAATGKNAIAVRMTITKQDDE